jgi:uncharacterized membrane protein YgdD (TMEM256/DUF423 family)
VQRTILFTASISALIAVALGAFGAHGLEKSLNSEALDTWEVGVRYQFYHSLAMFAVLGLAKVYNTQRALRSAWLFLLGILLFSGGLYLLSTQTITGINGSWIGPITPFGGLLFMAGWLLFLWDMRSVVR